MNTYETSATVEDQGQVCVAGVPFAPGTRVEITITPTQPGNGSPADSDRAARLLAALDNSRNTESVGPLRRAELYDREILH
ncbi:MAG: hypothetical protein KY476_13655 [Planctomycetes bacterium]|nr:hypothetical protein [Planctomycetota bacterium]